MYINSALYNRSSAARAGEEDTVKDGGKSDRPRLEMFASWSRLQFVTDKLCQAVVWSRRASCRSSSVRCTPHLYTYDTMNALSLQNRSESKSPFPKKKNQKKKITVVGSESCRVCCVRVVSTYRGDGHLSPWAALPRLFQAATSGRPRVAFCSDLPPLQLRPSSTHKSKWCVSTQCRSGRSEALTKLTHPT
jgi:hypothetical protein